MPLNTLLDPANILQIIALALSIFNLVAFLWLACTVWLNGDRRSLITRVGVVGLGLAALFFFIHALLLSSPLSQPTGLMPLNFLWHLIWLPALGATYIWFVIGLHYAALINEGWRRRRPLLLLCSSLLGCAVLVLLIINRPSPLPERCACWRMAMRAAIRAPGCSRPSSCSRCCSCSTSHSALSVPGSRRGALVGCCASCGLPVLRARRTYRCVSVWLMPSGTIRPMPNCWRSHNSPGTWRGRACCWRRC